MEAFRFLGQALTKNWVLKLLALALAIILYHSLKPAGASRAQQPGNEKTHDAVPFQSK